MSSILPRRFVRSPTTAILCCYFVTFTAYWVILFSTSVCKTFSLPHLRPVQLLLLTSHTVCKHCSLINIAFTHLEFSRFSHPLSSISWRCHFVLYRTLLSLKLTSKCSQARVVNVTWPYPENRSGAGFAKGTLTSISVEDRREVQEKTAMRWDGCINVEGKKLKCEVN